MVDVGNDAEVPNRLHSASNPRSKAFKFASSLVVCQFLMESKYVTAVPKFPGGQAAGNALAFAVQCPKFQDLFGTHLCRPKTDVEIYTNSTYLAIATQVIKSLRDFI